MRKHNQGPIQLPANFQRSLRGTFEKSSPRRSHCTGLGFTASAGRTEYCKGPRLSYYLIKCDESQPSTHHSVCNQLLLLHFCPLDFYRATVTSIQPNLVAFSCRTQGISQDSFDPVRQGLARGRGCDLWVQHSNCWDCAQSTDDIG